MLDLPQARREVELQYAAQGPNVVEIKDVYANIYCERRCLFVVMEHMGGKIVRIYFVHFLHFLYCFFIILIRF